VFVTHNLWSWKARGKERNKETQSVCEKKNVYVYKFEIEIDGFGIKILLKQGA
jgi:hypothetical protein